MTARNNFVLDNAINAYEHTADSALDRRTLDFLKELRDYRDSEEQGLLLRLPCKEGTEVYVIDSMLECKHDYDCPLCSNTYKCEEDIPCEHQYIQRFIRKTRFVHAMINNIGKTVFLTKEEAEQELAERKNNE